MKKGYKIVRIEDGGLFSFIVRGNGRVEYGIGRRTIPNRGCGPLCVFGTLKDAVLYNDGFTSYKGVGLYRCIYEPSIESNGHFGTAIESSSELPDGTVLAQGVTLTEKVR